MSAFYGPESPRPFAVVSEKFQKEISLLRHPTKEQMRDLYSFGDVYNTALCKSIAKLAEMNVDDRTCYVGPKKGSISWLVQDKLKLIHPIQEVNAGEIMYEMSTHSDRLIPVGIINENASEFFQNVSQDSNQTKFDKIIIRDSLEYIKDRKTFFMNAMRCLNQQGCLLVIQRPAEMSTLPYFSEAKKRLQETDVPYMDAINDIQSLGYDVAWDVEVLPVQLSRMNWFSLLYHRYPNQLEVTSSDDVFSGLRELSEGSLKYIWDELEFTDRLLFVAVTYPLKPTPLPACNRYGGSVLTTEPAPLRFKLAITEDIEPYVRDREKEIKQQSRKASFRTEWFGTVRKDKWELIDSKAIPSKRLNHLID